MATNEVDLDMALARLADEASPRPSPGLVGRVLADAALTTLAQEARIAAPRPTEALTARVLADAALTTLAREASPHPDARLVERVLADAASVAAAAACQAAAPAPARPRVGWGRRAASMLAVGWAGGALASLVLALAIGIGIGVRMEPGSLPILDDRGTESSDVLALAVLDGDFMSADGL